MSPRPRSAGGKTYSRFLSPGANPPRGKLRRISERDAKVLVLVAALRDAGQDHNAIVVRLEAEEENNWENLPPLFQDRDSNAIPVAHAGTRALESSELSALRTQPCNKECEKGESFCGAQLGRLPPDSVAAASATHPGTAHFSRNLYIVFVACEGELC